MGVTRYDEDDDDEGLDDREAPDASDIDDSEEIETLPCPYCGEPVYEQAEVCPHCRSFISREEASLRQPRWIVIAVILLLLAGLLSWGMWQAY